MKKFNVYRLDGKSVFEVGQYLGEKTAVRVVKALRDQATLEASPSNPVTSYYWYQNADADDPQGLVR